MAARRARGLRGAPAPARRGGARATPSSPRSARPRFTVEAVNERERTTEHDMAAFVDVLAESAGEAGRWIHFGLTSSDVLDTALALQLQAAGEVVVAGARELVAALAARAREHTATLCVGSTHGVHAEPTTFGIKLAGLAFEAHRNAAASGARLRPDAGRRDLRRRRHLLGDQPRVRAPRARAAGARAPRTSPRRSSRATATPRCSPRSRSPARGSSAWRPSCVTCSAPRCARPRSRFAAARRAPRRCPTSATRSRASRSPGLARVLRGNAQAALEDVALWHERDISHSSVERIVLPDSTIAARPPPARRDRARPRHDRRRATDAPEPRPHPRRAVLPGACCSR